VLRQILLDSGLRVLQDGSCAAITEHHLGSPTLPTTLPQVEHIDVFKIILAVGSVASRLQLAHQTPQGTVSRAMMTDSSDSESANAGDTKDRPPPTGTQDAYSGTPLPGNHQDTSTYLDTAVAAGSALESLNVQESSLTAPVLPSTIMQTHTLTPGSILSFGSPHLSILPDASGLALSDSSTLHPKDGETADIRLPDDGALRISRSGTMYLAETRTSDMTPQLSGLPEPARATEQITSEDPKSSRSISETSTGVATDGSTDTIAGGVSA
jgi:hypothetical protein